MCCFAVKSAISLNISNAYMFIREIELLMVHFIKCKAQIIILLFLLIFIFSGCRPENEEIIYERTGYALGTVNKIKIFDHGSEELLNVLFDRLNDIENKMSVNIEDSEVSTINKNAGVKPTKVSKETFGLIKKAVSFGELSRGAFDISLGPVIKLWGIGTENQRVPDKWEITKAVQLTGYKKIIIDSENQSIFLKDQGMGLDLGGIAKGYAADEIKGILKENNIKSAIIDLGGNIIVHGKKTDGTEWKVGIQNPYRERNDYLGVLNVSDKTIVTSGAYERFFIKDDVKYHHIFDGKTGYPCDNEVLAVTIVADISEDADALSTACFVLGVDDGMKLIDSLPGTGCIFVTKDNNIYISKELKDKFQLTSDLFTANG